jgi:hypothetical protein
MFDRASNWSAVSKERKNDPHLLACARSLGMLALGSPRLPSPGKRKSAGVIASSFWLCSYFGSRGRCIVPWQADNRGDRYDSDYNRLSGSHASRHSAGWVVRASCRVASWAEVRGSKARNLCCDTRTTTGPARSGGRAACTAACLAGALPWFDSILRTPCCDDQRANSSVELACRESCKVYSSASGFFSRRFFLGSYP